MPVLGCAVCLTDDHRDFVKIVRTLSAISTHCTARRGRTNRKLLHRFFPLPGVGVSMFSFHVTNRKAVLLLLALALGLSATGSELRAEPRRDNPFAGHYVG